MNWFYIPEIMVVAWFVAAGLTWFLYATGVEK